MIMVKVSDSQNYFDNLVDFVAMTPIKRPESTVFGSVPGAMVHLIAKFATSFNENFPFLVSYFARASENSRHYFRFPVWRVLPIITRHRFSLP